MTRICTRCGLDYEPAIAVEHNGIHQGWPGRGVVREGEPSLDEAWRAMVSRGEDAPQGQPQAG